MVQGKPTEALINVSFIKAILKDENRPGFPCYYQHMVVCRARHMFLRVSLTPCKYKVKTSPRPIQVEEKGVAVWQLSNR